MIRDGRLERATIAAAIVVPPDGNLHSTDYFRAVAAAVLAVADDAALSAPGAEVKGPDSGSATSRAASYANLPRKNTQRWRVLRAFVRPREYRSDGATGWTRDELGQALALPSNVIGPRVRELIDGGWLVPLYAGELKVAQRRTRGGHLAEVLILSDAARARLAAA
jgi:hypothetical protein